MTFLGHDLSLIARLALALAIGMLTGVERGWRERNEAAGGRTAGIRTFALLGLAGGVAGALAPTLGSWVAGLAIAGIGSVVAVFGYRENVATKTYSVTTSVAAFLVLLLGAYCVVGEMWVAAAVGVASVTVLALRESLHGWLKVLTWQELRAGILLLAMTFIALPLLPNQAVDPWGAINPYELWLMTILIAAISAVGYAAVRIGGPRRGIIFGALAGGLVSSTAVTQIFARRARKGAAVELASAAGMASAVSFLRTTIVAIAVLPELLVPVGVPLVIGAAALALASGLLWRRSPKEPDNAALQLTNPVEIEPVLLFALILAIVRIAAKLATKAFGAQGFVAVAAVTGVVDTDSIALSAGSGVTGGHVETAAIAILIAVTVNMLSKASIGFVSGGRAFGTPFGLLTAIAIAAIGLGGILVAVL